VPAVRDAVFRAMLSMPALAEGFLLKVLGTAEAKERREILQVLKGLDGAAVLDRVGRQFLVEADPEALKLAGEVLEKAGVRAEVHWVRGLEAAREGARALAAGGLKALKSRAGAAKAASLVLAEPNEAALEALADYLAAVGGAEAETAFLKGLREGSPAVKALSIRKLGELKIRTPLADVARAFRSEKEPLLRRACFDYLASLGKAAEQELLQALTDEDKLYRIEAAKALGEAGSEAAIPRLVEGLEDLDGGLRAAAEAALARLGTKALEAARQAAAKGTLKPRALESLETLVNRERVERELDRLVTDSGGTGFFAGRFMGLAEIPREISGPILIRLASDPQAQVRISARRERVQDYDALLRGLAVAALGELAVPGGKEALQKIVQEGESAPGEIHQEALLSLHRLGDAGPLDAHLKTLEARVEAGFAQKDPDEDAAAALFTRGLLLNRSGRRAEAAAAYERLVLAVDRAGEASRLKGELPMALYNLACLASLAGEKAKGVGLLVRAVKAGYRDRAWIEMDKDLDALRGEAGYRDLLADEALLPKPAPPK
jgi:HEAT repeat protein